MPFIISIKANKGFRISPETTFITLLLFDEKCGAVRFCFHPCFSRTILNRKSVTVIPFLCMPTRYKDTSRTSRALSELQTKTGSQAAPIKRFRFFFGLAAGKQRTIEDTHRYTNQI